MDRSLLSTWRKSTSQREQLTRTVIETNMMKAAQAKIAFHGGTNPIRHVIYIIKENRTYDQILGDLGVGNGMPALTMYGEEITPNEHKLARQFGVLDNFYDSGEVSGDGHVWSNAAISSDYTEKTWQQSYRGQGASLRLRGRGGERLSIARRHLGCQRARQRISLDQPGAPRQEPVSLRGVHFDQVLRQSRQRAQGIIPHTGNARTGAGAVRSARRYPSRRSDSAELRWRNEPVSLADSVDQGERGHQAGVGGSLRPEIS